MIISGEKGSLVLYWKSKLVSSHPIGQREYEDYKKSSNKFIINAMKEGRSFDDIKEKCLIFIHVFGNRRLNKEKVSMEDHIYFMMCLLFMIKIGFYDEDDYILVAPKKKKSKKKNIIKRKL
jgi:hypothetical protein